MSGEIHYSRERYGEAFWRMHHEAWCRSELKQREYGEAQGILLKAFGNWRAKFDYLDGIRRRSTCVHSTTGTRDRRRA